MNLECEIRRLSSIFDLVEIVATSTVRIRLILLVVVWGGANATAESWRNVIDNHNHNANHIHRSRRFIVPAFPIDWEF